MNNTKKRDEGTLTRRMRSAVRQTGKKTASLAASARRTILSIKLPRETSERIRMTLQFILFAALGFLLGRCDFGFSVYPLGLAFLIACESGSFAAYVGSALAAVTYPTLAMSFFGINTLIYIIRKILLSETMSESLRARVFLGGFTGLFICATLFLSSGTQNGIALAFYGRFNIILVSVLYCLSIPLAVFLFHPILSDSSFGKTRTAAALTFLGFCLVMSLPFSLPNGDFFSHFLAVLLTLFYCVTFEPTFAVCAAAVFGVATFNAPFSAPLALSAFLFTRLYEKRQIVIYPLFAALCAFLTVALCDFQSFSPTILLAVALSTLIFMPIGLVISSKKAVSSLEIPTSREAVGEAYTSRMAKLSGAFGSVSKLCYGFAGRLKFPSQDEAQVLIAVEASKVCSRCVCSKECRKKQVWCSGTLAKALTDGKLSAEQLPEGLRRVCQSSREIISKINEEYKRVLSERFSNNKTEILAREYASVAKILKYTSHLSAQDVHFDSHLTKKAARAADSLGLPNSGVTVYGTRRKILELCGVPVSAITQTSGALASYFGSELETVFDVPEFILDENSTFTMRFTSKERIAVEYVKATHAKCGETVCGDTVSFFESADSFFYALIADGMGSGREAAMTSRMTCVFVEKLLSGGAGKGVTMELLNSVLMSKTRESFSSVDLLEIDLITRRASFVKAGAAPAYLLRATKLFKVSSDTPPCGIIEGFCAEDTSFEVFSGDVIIMLSDGITSAIDCSVALCDIMSKHRSSPSEIVVQKILDLATSVAAHDDDMSCVMVKIK